MSGAIRGLGRFERAGGVFQFGQFVERRRRDKTVKAARGQAKALLPAIVGVVQHAKNIFHHVAHALCRAAFHTDEIGHFVEGQALPIARQRAREFENGGGFFQSHVQMPNVPMSEPDVSARYFPFCQEDANHAHSRPMDDPSVFLCVHKRQALQIPPDDDADLLDWIKTYGRGLRLPHLKHAPPMNLKKFWKSSARAGRNGGSGAPPSWRGRASPSRPRRRCKSGLISSSNVAG